MGRNLGRGPVLGGGERVARSHRRPAMPIPRRFVVFALLAASACASAEATVLDG